MDDLGKAEWGPQLESIMAREAEKCLCLSVLHRMAEQRYSRLNNVIQLPCIVLSTLAGTASVGSTSLFGTSAVAPVIIGGISISVGILSTLGSYFGFARRAEGHRGSYINYGKLHLFLMIELSLPASQRMAANDLLKTMREQVDRLYETSPPVPPAVIKVFKDEHGSEPISKPPETNGLDIVRVYQEEGTPKLKSININIK